MSEKPCLHCGQPLPEGARFCKKCGGKQETAAPAPSPRPEESPGRVSAPGTESPSFLHYDSPMFRRRAGAYCIDLLLICLATVSWPVDGYTFAYYSFIYFVVFDLILGVTLGKAIVGIRSRGVKGGRPSFWKFPIVVFLKITFVGLVLDVLLGLVIKEKKPRGTDGWLGLQLLSTVPPFF